MVDEHVRVGDNVGNDVHPLLVTKIGNTYATVYDDLEGRTVDLPYTMLRKYHNKDLMSKQDRYYHEEYARLKSRTKKKGKITERQLDDLISHADPRDRNEYYVVVPFGEDPDDSRSRSYTFFDNKRDAFAHAKRMNGTVHELNVHITSDSADYTFGRDIVKDFGNRSTQGDALKSMTESVRKILVEKKKSLNKLSGVYDFRKFQEYGAEYVIVPPYGNIDNPNDRRVRYTDDLNAAKRYADTVHGDVFRMDDNSEHEIVGSSIYEGKSKISKKKN